MSWQLNAVGERKAVQHWVKMAYIARKSMPADSAAKLTEQEESELDGVYELIQDTLERAPVGAVFKVEAYGTTTRLGFDPGGEALHAATIRIEPLYNFRRNTDPSILDL